MPKCRAMLLKILSICSALASEEMWICTLMCNDGLRFESTRAVALCASSVGLAAPESIRGVRVVGRLKLVTLAAAVGRPGELVDGGEPSWPVTSARVNTSKI